MNYEDSLDWLYNLKYHGTKLGLQNTVELLEKLGNPHEGLKIIHVAGTNGKGSVCAFISSILKEAGFKVGTYTSPHLQAFGERIAVNGYPMNRKETTKAIEKIKTIVEDMAGGNHGRNCTYFETVTGIAFDHFAKKKVDYAVLEVGMGGRLDSTNVVNPLVCVITNIGLEHTEHLGSTIEKIAYEKAGIIKKGKPVVCGVEQKGALDIVRKKSKQTGSQLITLQGNYETELIVKDIYGLEFSIQTPNTQVDNIRIKLAGAHQMKNAALAVAAVENLDIEISPRVTKQGLEMTDWKGRLHVARTNPLIIVDSTHNPPGSETLRSYLEEELKGLPVIGIIGMVKEKDSSSFLQNLDGHFKNLMFTSPEYDRGMHPEDLAASHEIKDVWAIEDTVAGAIDKALEIRENEVILITGSIFTASEALDYLSRLKIKHMMDILTGLYPIGAFPGRDVGNNEAVEIGTRDPFRVLISTILSQRTRDENTHVASENLFSVYRTPGELAGARLKDVERLVKPAGFYKQKAEKIVNVAKIIESDYGSQTPAEIDELLKLPGVGRKTANCVLVYGYGKPAIAVDTHVHRISNLFGLVNTKTPDETEEDLSTILPKDYWVNINRLIVRHGQAVCKPTKPQCAKCTLSDICEHGISTLRKPPKH